MIFDVVLTDDDDSNLYRRMKAYINNGLITFYSEAKEYSPSPHELGVMSMGLMEYLTENSMFDIGLNLKRSGITSRIDENGNVTFMEGGLTDLNDYFCKIIDDEVAKHSPGWGDKEVNVDIVEVR